MTNTHTHTHFKGRDLELRWRLLASTPISSPASNQQRACPPGGG